jgi:hypothetical protein
MNEAIPRTDLEVHVAGACIRKIDGETRILIARRNRSRLLYGGLYEGCGGRLVGNETFIEGVERHYWTEMGLCVVVVENDHVFYTIKTIGITIPGIRFKCIYFSGEAASKNHDLIRWVTEKELLEIPEEEFIPGLRQDFLNILRTEK